MRIIFALVVVIAVATGQEILRHDQDVGADGTFRYLYETSDGTLNQAAGDGNRVQGAYKYVSPDGTPIELSYVADINGFQPVGAHLPTVPPIPEYILRALQYIHDHPYKEDSQRKY